MNFRVFINLFTFIFYCCADDKNDQTYEDQINGDVKKILLEKRPNFENKQKEQENQIYSFFTKLKEQKDKQQKKIEEIKKKDHIFGKKEDFENSKNFSEEQKKRVQEAQNESIPVLFYSKANFYKIFDIESDDSKPTIHCCENAKIIFKKNKDTVEILSKDGIFYLVNRFEKSKKIIHHADDNFIFVSKPISIDELQKLLKNHLNKHIIIINNKFLNLENLTQEDKNRINFFLQKQGDNISYLSFQDYLDIENFKKKEVEKLNKEQTNLLAKKDQQSIEEYLKKKKESNIKIQEMINSKKKSLKVNFDKDEEENDESEDEEENDEDE